MEQWALALTQEVTSASDEQDVRRRAFNFLKLCKQFVETREVCSATLTAPCLSRDSYLWGLVRF